jgi:hypothetical protein
MAGEAEGRKIHRISDEECNDVHDFGGDREYWFGD